MAARKGEQFLNDLSTDNRELWFDGELVEDVTTHPQFAGRAGLVAAVEGAEEDLVESFLAEMEL